MVLLNVNCVLLNLPNVTEYIFLGKVILMIVILPGVLGAVPAHTVSKRYLHARFRGGSLTFVTEAVPTRRSQFQR